METTARNRTIGGIVIGAIILILLLVLFSCTVNGDPESAPTKDPTTGESAAVPGESDTLEPEEEPSESESESADAEVDGDDIVPAANTGVTFIPAGNVVPSGSTPTCELDPSACEDTRPPGAGVDICEIRPDLDQCQEPEPPTTPPPGDGDPTTPPDEDDDCLIDLGLGLICPPGDGDGGGDDDEEPGPGEPEEEDNTDPAPVTLNPCVVNSNTSASIDWSKAKDKSGISHYTVTSTPNAGDQGETSETSATFNNLDAGRTYTFTVTATDKAGNESDASNEATCVMDKTAPAVPVDLAVDRGEPSDSTLIVSWSESEDNTDGVGNVTYNLYRDGKLVGPVNDTVYEDTGLKAGTEYTYTVTAVDEAGNESDASVPVSRMTTSIAPTVPTGLDATNEGALGFDLEWKPSKDEDDVTPPAEIDYRVSVNGGVCFGGTVEDNTKFHVTCVLLWDTTEVTVTAIDGEGNESAPSEVLTVRSSGDQPGDMTMRSGTADKDKSDAPADKPALPEAPVEAPADVPTDVPTDEPIEKKTPLLTGLADALAGKDAAVEAPAEEPVAPEASPSPSEEPAPRSTTEEPVDEPTVEPTEEPTESAEEEAPAEEDDGGVLGGIVDSVTSAVAAVF